MYITKLLILYLYIFFNNLAKITIKPLICYTLLHCLKALIHRKIAHKHTIAIKVIPIR